MKSLLTHNIRAHSLPGFVIQEVKGLEGQGHFMGVLVLQGDNTRDAPRAK